MIIVSTTGYIVACIGPFLSDSSNNDASMMKNILLQNIDNILNWIEEVDHPFFEWNHLDSFSSRMISSWLTEDFVTPLV